MMSKAQSMSINTVVMAVLALIVLVILVLIFTGKLGKAGEGVDKTSAQFSGNDCEIPGSPRQCRLSAQACEQQGGFAVLDAVCPLGSGGNVCCSV